MKNQSFLTPVNTLNDVHCSVLKINIQNCEQDNVFNTVSIAKIFHTDLRQFGVNIKSLR